MENAIPILSGTELKITDFSLQTERVYSYPIHGHDYYEILIYDPFDGEIAVNGHTFHTEAPTAVLVTPKDFHSTTVFGSTEALCCKLQIAGETFEKHFAHPFVPIVTQEREQVTFLRMLVSQSDANRGNQELFTRCIELVVLSMQNSMGMLPSHSKSTALVSRATEMINRGFREPMTLKSVAAALYVSPQYLSEVFSRYAEILRFTSKSASPCLRVLPEEAPTPPQLLSRSTLFAINRSQPRNCVISEQNSGQTCLSV
jgi:AraC-like DNA-binding protein